MVSAYREGSRKKKLSPRKVGVLGRKKVKTLSASWNRENSRDGSAKQAAPLLGSQKKGG